MSTVLKLENGSKRGGSIVALRRVDLNVADNSYVVMFGARTGQSRIVVTHFDFAAPDTGEFRSS